MHLLYEHIAMVSLPPEHGFHAPPRSLARAGFLFVTKQANSLPCIAGVSTCLCENYTVCC